MKSLGAWAWVLSAAIATPLGAVTVADYERMLEERYLGPIPVPDDGIVLEVDVARFHLRSGELWLAEPLSSGAITGLVLVGDGRLEIDVPDGVELRQLSRFVENRELEGVDERFDRLLIRASMPHVVERLGELATGVSAEAQPVKLARERRQRMLESFREDAAARTVAALRNLGGRYFQAQIHTQRFGWLVFHYDDHLAEEIALQTLDARAAPHRRFPASAVETWLQLDRAEDRREDGRPSGTHRHGAELVHVAADVDLTELGRAPHRGLGRAHSRKAQIDVTVAYRVRRDGLGALRLVLDPMAVLEEVRSLQDSLRERPLPFLRFNTGAHDSSLDDRLHDPEVVVLLDEPAFAGDIVSLAFSLEQELVDYAGGLTWYPEPVGSDNEWHTGTLAIRHKSHTEVVALGTKLSEESLADGTVRTTFELTEPALMLGFSFARNAHRHRIERADLPAINLFGTTDGLMSPGRVATFRDDVPETLRFFVDRFGDPLFGEELTVSFTATGHAQAFRGLIQIPETLLIDGGRVGDNDHGYREFFLAHELSHLWWGHQVGWDSYRDQWLIEALAEYSAFLYVESELEGGDRVAERVLRAYTDEVTGSIKAAFDSFARPGVALSNRYGRDRLPPLAHGGRARIAESPFGSVSTVLYRKGMLVLHMIRMRCRVETGDDELFYAILGEMLARHRGGKISNHDLQAIVARHLAGDWERFFDQWVLGAEIPTLRWTKSLHRRGGEGWRLVLDVERSDVPFDFAVEVPVLVELRDGAKERRVIEVAERESRIELVLDEAPESVTFNENHGALARMRLRDREAQRLKAPVREAGSSR